MTEPTTKPRTRSRAVHDPTADVVLTNGDYDPDADVPLPVVPVFDTAPPRPANVVEALQRVMRDLPAIGKDDTADAAQGGYAFRGIESITRHAQVLLARHGVTFVPRVLQWDRDPVEVGRDRKVWHDERLLIEYDVYGPGGIDDKIVVGPIAAIGRDGADKGTNKCMTQAFKYALLQVLCVSDRADDADGTTVEAEGARRDVDPENDPATPQQVRMIRESARALRAAGIETVEQVGDTTTVLDVPLLYSDPETNTTRPVCSIAVAEDLQSRLAVQLAAVIQDDATNAADGNEDTAAAT